MPVLVSVDYIEEKKNEGRERDRQERFKACYILCYFDPNLLFELTFFSGSLFFCLWKKE